MANKEKGFVARLFGGKSEDHKNEKTGERAEDHAQQSMVDAAQQFHLLRVADVMVPRADIIAVSANMSLKDLANTFEEASHSRLPVYGETLDEPVGMVHIKDVLPYLGFGQKAKSRSTSQSYPQKKVVKSILRPILFVPPSMLAQDLLRRMQGRRIHMALVVDEYGGTDGLVSLEDLMEEIVGDIEDEHSEDVMEMQPIGDPEADQIWDVDARVDIKDFEEKYGREVATDGQEEDVDTLGGLVFTLAGRVPERGEVIGHPLFDLEFEVLDADARRLKRIRVRPAKTLKGSAKKETA